MKQFWFIVEIDKKHKKVVKAMVQATDQKSAEDYLRNTLNQFYENPPDFRILNKRSTLPDEMSYVIFGDSSKVHYITIHDKEVNK